MRRRLPPEFAQPRRIIGIYPAGGIGGEACSGLQPLKHVLGVEVHAQHQYLGVGQALQQQGQVQSCWREGRNVA